MARNFQGLCVRGDAIVDPSGTPVILRGAGLGGWMNMENFVTGYPANESAMREAVGSVLGWERADAFFERLLDRFFTREDAAFLAGLGVNCVRLPINQRHFESDADPFKWLSRGFERLAGMIELLGAHGIYSVIDLHAVPGSQNQHWHSDNATHVAAFWKHPHFMERATALWVELALRFASSPWVAGYNLLNEPADPTGAIVGSWHARTVAAVREVDPDHIVFLDGNTYSTDFSSFGEPVDNAVYACHDYARDGMAFGGPYEGDRGKLEATFLKRTAYQRQTGTPIWVGEFGPVYTGVPELDEPRYALLQDQLALYASYGAGWSLWTYKDVGLQGLVYASPSSFYLRLFGEFMAKKARPGVDSWGSTDREQAEVMEPLHGLIAREFPAWEPYPWDARSTTDDLVRHLLFAQAMLPEYAAYFRGLDDDALDALADSFSLAACVRRDRLCEIVTSATYSMS